MKNLLSYFLLCCVLSACSTDKSPESAVVAPPTPVVTDLTPAEFASKSREEILIDVRTPSEIAQGKIDHSLAMDYSQDDFFEKVSQLPKDREIYLYCAVGGRSSKAGELLIQQGFTKVYNLKGGLTAWRDAGLPISKLE